MPVASLIHASLYDALEVKGNGVTEEELWALLCHSSEAMQDIFLRGQAIADNGPSFIISPHTLLLQPTGQVRFAESVNTSQYDVSGYLPPEILAHSVSFSEVAIEKMYVYSLGMTIFWAAEFGKTPSRDSNKLTRSLHSLLLSMVEENPARRSGLIHVLEACTLHTQQFPIKVPYTHHLIRLAKMVLGNIQDLSSPLSDYDTHDGENTSREISVPAGRPLSLSGYNGTSKHQIQNSNAFDPLSMKRPQSRPSYHSEHSKHDARTKSMPLQNRQFSRYVNDSTTTIDSYDSHEDHKHSKYSKSKNSFKSYDETGAQSYHMSDIFTPSASQLPSRNRFRDRSPTVSRSRERSQRLSQSPPSRANSRYSRASQAYERLRERRERLSVLRGGMGMPPDLIQSSSSYQSGDSSGSDFEDGRNYKKTRTKRYKSFQSIASGHSTQEGSYHPDQFPYYPSNTTLHTDGNFGDQNLPDYSDNLNVNGQPGKLSVPTPTPDVIRRRNGEVGNQRQKHPRRKLKKFFGPEFAVAHEEANVSLSADPSMLSRSGKLPPSRKKVTCVLLNGRRLNLMCDLGTTGKEMFELVVKYLDILEHFFFGLAYIRDGEYLFLEPDEKLHKVGPPSWKEEVKKKSRISNQSFTVFFRVKFYVENPGLLRHITTRHQYYLQLRKDILEERTKCDEQAALQLASLALQAEMGDYASSSATRNYFLPEQYLPVYVISAIGVAEIRRRLPPMHELQKGMAEEQAELEFLMEARKLAEYGIHFHRISQSKKENELSLWVGLCTRGVILYDKRGKQRVPTQRHPWHLTKKIAFNRKRFVIEARDTDGRIILYTDNYKKGRYLLQFSKQQHRFQMAMRQKLNTSQQFNKEYPLDSDSFGGSISQSISIGYNFHDHEDSFDDGFEDSLRDSYQPQTSIPNNGAKSGFRLNNYDNSHEQDSILEYSLTGDAQYENVREVRGRPSSKRTQSFEEIDGKIVDDYDMEAEDPAYATIDSIRRKREKQNEQRDRSLDRKTDPQAKVIDSSIRSQPQTPFTPGLNPNETISNSLRQRLDELPVPETPEREIITVKIQKDPELGIGVTIVGGENSRNLDLGVFIKSVTPDGPAERNGRIKPGDRIISINNRSLEGVSHKGAVEMIQTSKNVVKMILSQPKTPDPDFMHAIESSNDHFKESPYATVDNHKPLAIDNTRQTNTQPLVDLHDTKQLPPVKPKRRPESFGSQYNLGVSDQPPGPLTNGNLLTVPNVNESNTNGLNHTDGINSEDDSQNDIDFGSDEEDEFRSDRDNVTTPEHTDFEDMIPDKTPGSRKPLVLQSAEKELSREEPVDSQRTPTSTAVAVDSETSDDLLPEDLNPGDRFAVRLKKINNSLGISVTGGINTSVKHGGIYIKTITKGGAADQTGQIQVGDRVISVNDDPLTSVTHKQAVEALRKAPAVTSLVIERGVPPSGATALPPTPTLPQMADETSVAKGLEEAAATSGSYHQTDDDDGDGRNPHQSSGVTSPMSDNANQSTTKVPNNSVVVSPQIALSHDEMSSPAFSDSEDIQMVLPSDYGTRDSTPFGLPARDVGDDEDSESHISTETPTIEDFGDALSLNSNVPDLSHDQSYNSKEDVNKAESEEDLSMDDDNDEETYIRRQVVSPALSTQEADLLERISSPSQNNVIPSTVHPNPSLETTPRSPAPELVFTSPPSSPVDSEWSNTPPSSVMEEPSLLVDNSVFSPSSTLSRTGNFSFNDMSLTGTMRSVIGQGVTIDLPDLPYVTPDNTFEVELLKGSQGLGFSIQGGKDAHEDPIIQLIRIKRIFAGQPAAESDMIEVNDVILKVNQAVVHGLTHAETVGVLRSASNPVSLLLCRPNEEELDNIRLKAEQAEMEANLSISPRPVTPSQNPSPADNTSLFSSPSPTKLNGDDNDDESRIPTPPSTSPPKSPLEDQKKSDNNEIFEVNLVKPARGGLGFTVSGGAKTGGCYIKGVVDDPAKSDGRMQQGDKILEVNGQDITVMSHFDAVSFLRMTPKEVNIKLSRPKKSEVSSEPITGPLSDPASPPSSLVSITSNLPVIEMERNAAGHLGLSLTLDLKGRRPGVFISDVIPGLPADLEGSIQPGDQVHYINGQSLSGLGLLQARRALEAAAPVVKLQLTRKGEPVVEIPKVTPPVSDVDDESEHSKLEVSQNTNVDSALNSTGGKNKSGKLENNNHLKPIRTHNLRSESDIDLGDISSDSDWEDFSSDGDQLKDVDNLLASIEANRKEFQSNKPADDVSKAHQKEEKEDVEEKEKEEENTKKLMKDNPLSPLPLILPAVNTSTPAEGENTLKRTPIVSQNSFDQLKDPKSPGTLSNISAASDDRLQSPAFDFSASEDDKLSPADNEHKFSFSEKDIANRPSTPLSNDENASGDVSPAQHTPWSPSVKSPVLSVNEASRLAIRSPSPTDTDVSKQEETSRQGGVIRIEFEKPASGGLGFSLIGGEKGGKTSVFIKTITPGGVAANDGRLRIGDKLLQVNGQSLVGMTHNKAISLLRRAKGTVKLAIVRASSRPVSRMEENGASDADELDAHLDILNDKSYEKNHSQLTEPEMSEVTGSVLESQSMMSSQGNDPVETGRNGHNTDSDLDSVPDLPVEREAINKASKLISKVVQVRQLSDTENSESWNSDTELPLENNNHTPRETPSIKIMGVITDTELQRMSLVKPSSSSRYSGRLLKTMLSNLNRAIDKEDPVEEYKQLRQLKPIDNCDVAKKPVNKDKNRYRNVLPYDKTRVTLQNGDGSDYINASHIQMKVGTNELQYIACQGPLPNSLVDFWQMIWEQKVSVIAMVTMDIENGKVKCHRYWPSSTDSPVVVTDRFEIRLDSLQTLENFDIRRMTITNLKTSEIQHVSHLNFTTWPDHGVPTTSIHLLRYIKYMRRIHQSGPIVVHCSAGIGRTGTLITIDTMMNLVDQNEQFKIYDIVKELRRQRHGMIQTKDQYIFCYKAALETLKSLT
ncbi:tyrosine-protein phosphatase non-receptor type 13-like isoform X2 [Anneissia japonica]|uniref:tyrosine-protein phosphatase non-receptor type 13-like isoform X2 n=1 Tax=Anneissia japonica TaxID=1529436 RepID=UPI001425B3F1|nr:tyrosine-protein phosphatase non-receptor type 13-like isoform X2 [Anneissia japonica]